MSQVINKIGVLLLFVLVGCAGRHPDQLLPASYIQYVEDENNQLKNTVKSGIWSYTFQYKPGGYIALKELDADSVTGARVSKRIASLEKTVWFNVHISVAGKGDDPLKYQVADLQDYNRRLDYFLNKAAANFRLLYGDKGEAEQIGYYFENNYNVKPEVVLIIGFKIPDAVPQESVTLEYADELFNAGILKFKVPETIIKQIPKLSINS